MALILPKPTVGQLSYGLTAFMSPEEVAKLDSVHIVAYDPETEIAVLTPTGWKKVMSFCERKKGRVT